MWKQVLAVTAMNLRSLPGRPAASIVVILGIAGVVGVLVAVLAMATGLTKTYVDAGDPARAIVLHKAATAEGFSSIDVGWIGAIDDAPGVLRSADGTPAVCPEYVVATDQPTRVPGRDAGVTLRGTCKATRLVHPQWRLVAGRWFRPGLHELVVGSAAAAEFPGLGLGDHLELAGSDWTVVGRFASGGDAHASEVLADVHTLMSAYNWGSYSSVTVRLDSPGAFAGFKRALLANPTLQVDVEREQDYYTSQSKGIAGLLYVVSTIVAAIMAIGAVFTALNTLYSAVAARTSEIATLRAIGFGPAGVVVSVLIESLLLAVVGAVIGAAVAWLLFNGDALTTQGGGGFGSEVTFRMLIRPALVAVGIAWACAIGMIGGLLPAIRAARLPVAVALRPR